MQSYPIYTDPVSEIDFSAKKVINTINQYSYCIAEEDDQFKIALEESDVLLPDGVGITIFYRLLHGKKIKKIAGADIHRHLLMQLNERKGSCFYLGSSNHTLGLIEKKLKEEYPNIRVGTFSPPYKPAFSIEENAQMVKAVNEFKPDAVFVGMTAPKQEKWVQVHKDLLQTTLICSIGAVFDFYAGTIKRPGKFWINLGLEWFMRLLKEPKRMSKRYLYYGPVFIFLMLKEKWKQSFSKK
jgi:N-acetylglucosaminyldiphosphoundecaprenol N-acetyl-beta-D-mannosaminyltransferase